MPQRSATSTPTLSQPTPDLAKRYLQMLAAAAGWVLENVLSILIGFNNRPDTIPLFGWVLTNPLAALGVAGVIVALAVVAVVAIMAVRKRTPAVPTNHAHRVARIYLRVMVALVYLVIGGSFSIVLGFNSAGSISPLLIVIKQYPTEAILLGTALLAFTLLALLIHPRVEPEKPPDAGGSWRIPRAWVSIGISTTSSVLFTALLLTVLLRPAWCPAALCPAPVQVKVTNPNGTHDQNLEGYFTAFQSATLALSASATQASPASLPLNTDPRAVGAVRIDQPNAPPYRIVIGVHSLQQGRFGLIVEQVALVVVALAAPPTPLGVAFVGSPLDYSSAPFRVTYAGQANGAILPATYLPDPALHVQLSPGESDELDVQLLSRVVGDVRFRIEVTYRVADQSQLQTVMLPQTFEVVFSDGTNWHVLPA